MKKRLVLGLVFGTLAALVFATMSTPAQADKEPPCVRKAFKTKLVGDACKKGQKSAARAMKGFVKDVKNAKKAEGVEDFKLTCDHCHKKLKPDFPLEDKAVAEFEKLQKYLATKK